MQKLPQKSIILRTSVDTFDYIVRCYKRGSYLFSSGVSYEAGDIIRVERNVGSYINFYLNSIPIGRKSHDATQKLYFDCSFNENGSFFMSPTIIVWPPFSYVLDK